MSGQHNYTLINPNTGHLAFKIFDFESCERFDHLQRNNFFSLIFIKQGSGEVKADFSKHHFQDGAMFAFSPYQPFLFSSDGECNGFAIQFHPDFFCIHKHQNEVACNGVLFNNIYEPPYLTLSTQQQEHINIIVSQLKSEIMNNDLAQYELLVAHLKILLIHLSRIKMEQKPEESKELLKGEKPFVLQNLKDAIEDHFKIKHSAGEYADLLNISAKALAKITKSHFNKTVTELISERIIIEAKRELYLTSKTVKEIANELGYQDEYYFSRFFKTNADISPQMYRDTVGFAVAEK